MTKDNDASLFLPDQQTENIRRNPNRPKHKNTAPLKSRAVGEGQKREPETPDPEEVASIEIPLRGMPPEVLAEIDNLLGGTLEGRAATWGKSRKPRSMRRAQKIL